MDEQRYIEIWMNDRLTDDQKRAMIPSDIYARFAEIDESLKSLRAPVWDVQQELQSFHERKGQRGAKVVSLVPRFALAAAAVITLLIVYFFLMRSPITEIITQPGESLTYYLPDSSRVIINDGSTLSFNPESWKENRKVRLEGEAYFSVKKGSQFKVEGTDWSVVVLGTKFNVIARDQVLDVKCFEGKVKVKYLESEKILEQGQGVSARSNTLNSTTFSTTSEEPTWISGVSEFNSQPISYVLEEMERQFNIEIQTFGLDERKLFTGSFDHSDLESALNTLSLTTGCKVEVNEKLAIFRCE